MGMVTSGAKYNGVVIKKITVTVTLTAEDWQLFTASMDCIEAARALNKAASKALSLGDPYKAHKIFWAAQNEWAEFGAADSEPSHVFDDLYLDVYGDEAYTRYR